MQVNQATSSPLTVNLHGLKLAFQSPDPALRDRFKLVYGHLPREEDTEPDIFIGWHVHKLPMAPLPPPGMPALSAGDQVSYYGHENLVSIRMPKYGLITVDLNSQRLVGAVTRNCLEVYGAFEDVLMISLAPLYRRQGWFALHAFAALAPSDKVALISGPIGSGKTTTGLALLNTGWKLISNDSPLLTRQAGLVHVLAYPGRLSAFDDSLARFENLKKFIPDEAQPKPETIDLMAPSGPRKREFRVEEAFTDPWAWSGVAGGIFFPEIVSGLTQSELVQVPPKEAVLQLIPQAIEGWDKAAIAQNLQLLGQLVEQVPCYALKLSPNIDELPGLIASGMEK